MPLPSNPQKPQKPHKPQKPQKPSLQRAAPHSHHLHKWARTSQSLDQGLGTDYAEVTALLAACCFFLSAIEYMLPKPLPFMRLGIANLPLLLAVDLLPFQWYMVLAAAKVVGMSIVSGTLFSYVALFSLVGTMVAALAMRATRAIGKTAVSLIGISIGGAIASNAIQMLIARYVIFGDVAWLIAPLFLATGLVTGTLMGLFSELFVERSTWLARIKKSASGVASLEPAASHTEDQPGEAIVDKPQFSKLAQSADCEDGAQSPPARHNSRHNSRREQNRLTRRDRYEARMEPWISALLGVAIAALFLAQKDIGAKVIYLLLFIFWTWASGKRFSLVSTVLVTLGIVAANLLIPSGRVLIKIGPLAVTQLALIEGFSKALTFEGLMYLSKAAIMPSLQLPGKFGALIAQAFQYYDQIIEYQGTIHAKTIVYDIDALLTTIWAEKWRLHS